MKIQKSVIRIVCFLVVLVTVLLYCNKVLKVKYGDGIYSLTTFYEQKRDMVDVLVLGSSHAFENFNTGTLWYDYGMASFVLAGSLQPMWNTYYYLKEALKTQKPKLIVLEGYRLTFTDEYENDNTIIKNNFGLYWSADKIESLKASVPKERLVEFVLEYTQYHSRYKELTREDFLHHQGSPFYDDWKGFGCNMETEPMTSKNVDKIEGRENLSEKTEKYYRAIINLAKEKDIPIVVVVAPYAAINFEDQKYFNKASDIAKELGVSFVNCNTLIDEIGIDYNEDAADVTHLNYKGNQKFTKYVGKFLKENFDIPDRRGDKAYESWDRQARYIEQMIYDYELTETKDVKVLCKKIKNKNYWTFISLNGKYDMDRIKNHFSDMGIVDIGNSGIWFLENDNIVWHTGVENDDYYKRIKPHDFELLRIKNAAGEYDNHIIIDNTYYTKVANGINVVVYDTLTEEIADVYGIDADNGYKVVR